MAQPQRDVGEGYTAAGLRFVGHRVDINAGDTRRVRCGVFRGAPVGAVVAEDGILAVDHHTSDTLHELIAPIGTICLDVSIGSDGIFSLAVDHDEFVITRLLGVGGPERLVLDLPPWDDMPSGALHVVDGVPQALVLHDHLMHFQGSGTGQQCLAWTKRYFGYGVVDLLPPAEPGDSPFGILVQDDPPGIGGGGLTPGSPGWGASPLVVQHREPEYPLWVNHELTDAWVGHLGGAAVVAHGGVSSIQVRDLATGQLISARVIGDGLEEEVEETPISVAFQGDLVAILLADRLEIRSWDDFAILDRRDIPRMHGSFAVRLVEAQGKVWVVGADRDGLWFDEVRYPRPLRTSVTAVPRSWRSVSVGLDAGAVAGIDPDGAVWALGSDWYREVLKDLDGSTQTDQWSGQFRIGPGQWSGLRLGNMETVHRIGLWDDGHWAVAHAIPEIERWIRSAPDDPVQDIVFSHGMQYLVRASGRITAGPENSSEEDQFWSESDPIVRLLVPQRPEGQWPVAPVAVVALDRMGEWSRIVLRDSQDGSRLADHIAGSLRGIDAAWVGGTLCIVILTAGPWAMTVLEWDGVALSVVLETRGTPARSVAVAPGGGGPIIALLLADRVNVIDGRTGHPLGLATLNPDTFVLVEGPGGANFLAGGDVLALPSPWPWQGSWGDERLALRPAGFGPGDLTARLIRSGAPVERPADADYDG